jgi:hypothetical protein
VQALAVVEVDLEEEVDLVLDRVLGLALEILNQILSTKML